MTTVTKDSPEIVNATRRRLNPTTRARETVTAYPTEADRIAAAAAWNADNVNGLRREAVELFEAEALTRIQAQIPEFDTIAEVKTLRAMALNGMLTAPAGWSAEGRAVRDIVQYVAQQALPRIRGVGGHPDLTSEQLSTVIGQVSTALPFAGVDVTDLGWPVV